MGSKNIKDLTGSKIGVLNVLKRYRYIPENQKQMQTFYDCICQCGTVIHVSHSNLISSKHNTQVIRSCGCLQVAWLVARSKKNPSEAARNSIYSQYCQNAKQRNIAFCLSKEEFFALVFNDCHYCGTSASTWTNIQTTNSDPGNLKYSGIDRMNNDLGYTTSNCVPCCKWCNIAKRSFSYYEFLYRIHQTVVAMQNSEQQVSISDFFPIVELTDASSTTVKTIRRSSKRKPDKDRVLTYLFTIYKRNARNMGKEFTLTREELKSLVLAPCVYCLTPYSMCTYPSGGKEAGRSPLLHNGVSRIDPLIGYTRNNCISACKFCSQAKHSRNEKEYISWLMQIYTHQKLDKVNWKELL